MARKNRTMIEKRERDVVFKNNARGHFTIDDLTKQTGGIGSVRHSK